MNNTPHPFSAAREIETPLGRRTVYALDSVRDHGDVNSLPYSIKVLLESALRKCDGRVVTEEDVIALASYNAIKVPESEIPFSPGRVVLQDFTGVPAIVDLAAMRDAIVRMTGDPDAARRVNPQVPCDLVIDHSIQVDTFNSKDALRINSRHEFERNRERYEFLKWGRSAFDNFRVVPPATGIVHQVNLEYLAKVVWDDGATLYPDSLVGTDSHTTMINGLGVLGWGVGGIEAEAAMVGQPIFMLAPEVVGVRLTGRLPEGTTATDLVLRITEILREQGVVGRFVEFHGPGLDAMPLATRATIANMAPEYGATCGFFPIDQHTLDYLKLTGRSRELIETVEQYALLQGLWRDNRHEIVYTDLVDLDMGSIESSLAGPRRPQDRIALGAMKTQWAEDRATTFAGHGLADGAENVTGEGTTFDLENGAVVIAAITSCTNTSNPEVMIGAGLLARKARQLGLTRRPWVKTSLAPGSRVVTDYLDRSGLTEYLEALGFFNVGYGCTTCIGNSGPLPEPIAQAIESHDLVVASVLSGNRNFEGRISPHIRANYLASPPLVVAYALAGTVDIDLTAEPLGQDDSGHDVYLRDIWPSPNEIAEIASRSISADQFTRQYATVFDGSAEWQAITTESSSLFNWDSSSTYIQAPPFFDGLTMEPDEIEPIHGARVLVMVGDSVTTDHISPAGSIPSDTPAGRFLTEAGVPTLAFNSYGSRRGNDRIMARGTFANLRVKNRLAPGTEGGWTTDFTDGQVKTIFEASLSYRAAGTPSIVIAGIDYGMGSSRDWAAKGPFLLGVKAVIAESYERIHRSNLVGMGILPLEFMPGDNADSLGLDGTETFDIQVDNSMRPRQEVRVTARKADGTQVDITTMSRVDTPVEVDYYRNGGILHTVLKEMAG
ncbi:MAG: aconitate hydratase AcnA [Acidimicrobiia bacterium]|nr:aconitate hydratase AcnA [Acidimicrobiia bacterium]MXZ06180.1 aconitate hydratase AcnA [Acidimicrobiia bacterium]MYD03770.1 aconitate hydratase AcnA [Acidimicrobiia bacterium]